MKHIILAILAAIITISASAQSGKSIYNKYSDKKGVSAVYISPSMFKMIGRLPDIEFDDAQMGDTELNVSGIVQSFEGFYVLEVENNLQAAADLAADVNKLIKNGKYELLLEAKEDGENTRIYQNVDKDQVCSLVILTVDDDETDFICIDGRINQADLQKLLAYSLR